MKLTLHQLSIFQAISECGSITLAAKARHMTQPAVSNLVRQLEDFYGCALLERVGKQIFLTEAGQKVLACAKQVNTLIDETKLDIDLMQGRLTGSMKVAVVSTAQYFMPRLLGAFKQKVPGVNVSLKVCNREQVIERLKNNADDFVIMSHPPEDMPLNIQNFYQDHLVVAACASFKVKKRSLSLKDLANDDWLVRERGSGTRFAMQKIFSHYKLLPSITMEVGNNESIKQMIIAGMGISILSEQSIEIELANQLIKTLPVKGFPLPHEWYLVSPKGKQPSALVLAFKEFVETHPDLAHYNSP